MTRLVLVAVALAPCGCSSTDGAERRPRKELVAPAPSTEAKRPLPDSPAAITAKPLAVGSELEEDPALLALLAPHAEEVSARANRVVGRLETPLDKAPRGAPESTLGNWVTDAIRTQMTEKIGRRLDVCFTNNGGLRRSLPAGEVTEGMIVELMPFDNAIVVMDVSGERAAAIFAHLAATGDPASGITYVQSGQSGSGPGDLLVGGHPLDRGKSYSICTTDYLFEGGGGYELADVTSVTYTGVLLRDVLLEDFEEAQRAGRPIRGVIDGRARTASAAPMGADPGEGT